MSTVKHTDWNEADKAAWILKHGKPDIVWIFERVDNTVYKRPMGDPDGNKPIPPWISMKRQVAFVSNGDTFVETRRQIHEHIEEHTDD